MPYYCLVLVHVIPFVRSRRLPSPSLRYRTGNLGGTTIQFPIWPDETGKPQPLQFHHPVASCLACCVLFRLQDTRGTPSSDRINRSATHSHSLTAAAPYIHCVVSCSAFLAFFGSHKACSNKSSAVGIHQPDGNPSSSCASLQTSVGEDPSQYQQYGREGNTAP
ncbi:hypothetical protein F4780DRAFT_72096 [Xylariomycetidae sp. FL0641]|nr:hypothetical protein F4780DRAFT_72096 [Xylariomycetidae sp. FL0641]